MRLKLAGIIVLLVSVITVAFWGCNMTKEDSLFGRKSQKEANQERQEKEREKLRKKRTMFAVKANQILLTTKKLRVAAN